MARVELRNVEKTYGRVIAVASVSLDVQEGEFVALLGPSGCGKTTLLRMVAGFIRPNRGEIRIGGRNVVGVPVHRRNTAMVFQQYALFPHLTARGNVAFGLEMRNLPRREIEARVAKALELVRLGAHADRFPRQLSGGQQQRVALARALVTEPAVLLLDEPLSGLDARLRQEMREEIRDVQRQLGITTIFVTHDREEALGMADRVVVMNAGRVEQVGDAVAIYRRPATRFVAEFLGDANFIAATVERIDGDRITLRHPAGALLAGLPPAPTARPPESPSLAAAGGANDARPTLAPGAAALAVVRPDTVRPLPADTTGADAAPAGAASSDQAGTGPRPGGAAGASGETMNAVPATVEAATFLGSRVEVRLSTPLGPLRAAGDPAALGPLRPGMSVRVGWPAGETVVLPA